MAYSRAQYERYLNSIGMEEVEEYMIIGGKMRKGLYGTMLRKHDPTAFNVGYNEWRRKKECANYYLDAQFNLADLNRF